MNSNTLKGFEEGEGAAYVRVPTQGLVPYRQAHYHLPAPDSTNFHQTSERKQELSRTFSFIHTILSIPLGPRLVLMASATAVKQKKNRNQDLKEQSALFQICPTDYGINQNTSHVLLCYAYACEIQTGTTQSYVLRVLFPLLVRTGPAAREQLDSLTQHTTHSSALSLPQEHKLLETHLQGPQSNKFSVFHNQYAFCLYQVKSKEFNRKYRV